MDALDVDVQGVLAWVALATILALIGLIALHLSPMDLLHVKVEPVKPVLIQEVLSTDFALNGLPARPAVLIIIIDSLDN